LYSVFQSVVCLFAVIAVTRLLLAAGNSSPDDMLYQVVSASATAGLSLSATPKLNLFGQTIIMLMIARGRLGALTILPALAQRRPPEPIQYPEELLLTG
jgi:trk system potassium uptake protein